MRVLHPGVPARDACLLERNAKPDRSEIERALAGHTCRCTGYVKILEAVEGALRGDVGDFDLMPEPSAGEPEVLIPGSPA